MNEPRQLVKIAPTLRYFPITALAPMMQRMREDARLPSAFILELGTTVLRTFAAANSGCMCWHVLCPPAIPCWLRKRARPPRASLLPDHANADLETQHMVETAPFNHLHYLGQSSQQLEVSQPQANMPGQIA